MEEVMLVEFFFELELTGFLHHRKFLGFSCVSVLVDDIGVQGDQSQLVL
jgi:hypothetical protein